jgi:hypothetical protein
MIQQPIFEISFMATFEYLIGGEIGYPCCPGGGYPWWLGTPRGGSGSPECEKFDIFKMSNGSISSNPNGET